MAASSSLHELEDLLTCPVCLEPFRNPRTLSCGHEFCERCLSRIAVSSETGNQTIFCPSCRKITVALENVTSLPRAFRVTHIQEKVENLPKEPQTFPGRHCEECIQVSATKRCCESECKRNLCHSCVVRHEKFKHKTVRITDNLFCATHNTDIVTYYCTNCHLGICEFCKLEGSHNEHDIKNITKLAKYWREILDDKIKNHEDSSELDQTEHQVNMLRKQMHEDGQVFKEKIGQILKSLQQVQDLINGELSDFNAKAATKENFFSEITDQVKNIKSSRRQYLEKVSELLATTTSDQELVGNMSEIDSYSNGLESSKRITKMSTNSPRNWISVSKKYQSWINSQRYKPATCDVSSDCNNLVQFHDVSTDTDYNKHKVQNVSKRSIWGQTFTFILFLAVIVLLIAVAVQITTVIPRPIYM